MTPEERRLYWVWGSMVQRCHNPRSRGYANYGAKGITVCNSWRSFNGFASDMGIPPAGHSIDRIDGARGYEPSNCRWATRQQQNSNRPTWCRYVTVAGERLTLKGAWRKHAHPSVTYRSLVKRIVARGWPIDQALAKSAGDRRAA